MHNPLKQLLCTSFIAQPFRRSWYSTEGDSEIVGVERMSVTYRQPACTVKLKMIICGNRKKEMNYKDKRHSENTDTSTSVTFHLVVWPPFVKLKKADATYCIVPCYQVWFLWIYYFTRYQHLFILCDLWPSLVTFSFCQCHLLLCC